MPHPLLYEINTRCWLRELSAKSGGPVTLASVPDAEFALWQGRGFTHVWLMGVWTTGPRSGAEALKDDRLRRAYDEALPDWSEADVLGSPYAIADYRVPDALGGEEALKKFHHGLRERGMKLVLDFVPNHLGLDHPWANERPELFVQSPAQAPETFRQETASGTCWLAHGKDPHFPAWTDTVQLDYRRPKTRAAMTDLLQSIADRCDGVRCDMAMLLLNDVFARTWAHLPSRAGALPAAEFWSNAIPAVKQAHPDFVFLAEAYWGLEARLQSLGFDYTYDKRLYDVLIQQHYGDVQKALLDPPSEFVGRSAHFLENHDEPRVASKLAFKAHRAAALVVLGLPGLRLLHEGQLRGATVRLPVQLGRRRLEPVAPDIAALYDRLLTTLRNSAVGQGKGELLRPRAAWPENPTGQNFVLVQWQSRPEEFDLVVVNFAPHRSQCFAPLNIPKLAQHNWEVKDLLSEERYHRRGEDLQSRGLYLDLPPFGTHVWHFQPVG